VIKGPQATLFGTASTVGAISLVSARPRAGFSGQLTGGYGNYNQALLGGFLNAGSDVLAGRIAFEWRTRDGYVDNLNPAQRKELYAQNQLGVRASLRSTPTGDLTIDLIGTLDQQRNSPAFLGAPGGPANAFEKAKLGGNPAGAAALGDDPLGLEPRGP
jgi:outer membrane receptor protein involved in Fe transport